MGTHSNRGPRQTLSEINVTPLVDVMLVLLIIFMVAAGAQTVEVEQQKQQMLDKAEEILEEAQKVREQKEAHRKVDIELPRVNSKEVILSEVKKLKLEVDGRLRFILDKLVVVDCLALSPSMRAFFGSRTGGASAPADLQSKAFAPCLKALAEKLVDNHKLQTDKELYLLADRRLDYGLVLKVMAAVRQAGVTKFGLVAQSDLLKGIEVERTPQDVK
jgi:biopolymer transport protein TolR